jgi:hypothetical protein
MGTLGVRGVLAATVLQVQSYLVGPVQCRPRPNPATSETPGLVIPLRWRWLDRVALCGRPGPRQEGRAASPPTSESVMNATCPDVSHQCFLDDSWPQLGVHVSDHSSFGAVETTASQRAVPLASLPPFGDRGGCDGRALRRVRHVAVLLSPTRLGPGRCRSEPRQCVLPSYRNDSPAAACTHPKPALISRAREALSCSITKPCRCGSSRGTSWHFLPEFQHWQVSSRGFLPSSTHFTR